MGNTWIFQAVPEEYDLLIVVPKKIHIGDSWRVTRFWRKIRKGDRLLFWQAGSGAGIYAIGKTSSVPYQRGKKWRVRVQYAEMLEKPVLKTMLKEHPLLKKLTILRQQRGTNFQVEPAEWMALDKVIRSRHPDIPDKLARAEQAAGVFNPKNKHDARKRIQASIFRRQGQPEFRRKLLRIYAGKCLLSDCNAEEALEAAHICPYRGTHTNHPENGLLLRSDLHTLFDLYLISIDASRKRLLLAPTLQRTCYAGLKGRKIRFPRNGPSIAALDQHRAEFERLRCR